MLIDSFCQVTIDQLSELMILATTHHLAEELSRPFFSICWICWFLSGKLTDFPCLCIGPYNPSIGEYNSETLNVIVDIMIVKFPI